MLDDPTYALIAFAVSAAVILTAGVRLSGVADKLADRTGLGEVLIGAILLGAATSLPGVVTSITAAAGGHPELAFSNALGGIAAQTFFLAVADICYRKANLEHAASTEQVLLQTGILIVLLALPAFAMLAPDVSLLAVHPVTPVLLVVYIFGLRLTGDARAKPMWTPRKTDDTHEDVPDDTDLPPLARLVTEFAILAAILGATGWVLANAGVTIAGWAGLSETLVGALFTAVTTSLPELVTTIAAVRRGALQLALGGIIGGNTFDVLFLVASDVAYRDGSLYHAVGPRDLFLVAWAILMTATLLVGLVRRERKGLGGIGFESVALVVIFAAGVAIQALQG
ncbi:MAG: sodium:calcium antiporter [Alphaproteobacteria bacterium]|nr:sodium:calcium antiporter [Alphaproteobacteria bacterium]